MPSVIVSPAVSSVFPSALELVNRVLNECRMESVAALDGAGANFFSSLTLEALNDSQAEIWNRNRWDWQLRDAAVEWVAGQYDYVLPTDFDRSAGDLFVGLNVPAKEWDTTSWRSTFGTYQVGTVPASSGVTDYTIQGTTLRVFPPPSAEWIASYPLGSLVYLRKLPDRLTTADGGDSFDVPVEFLEAMVCFAKARLLRARGGDTGEIQFNDNRFETVLLREIRRTRRTHGPSKMRLPGPLVQGMNTE